MVSRARPLVILTGQGIARSDGFNLLAELRNTPAVSCVTRSDDVDQIFSDCRQADDESFQLLLTQTRELCRAARQRGHDAQHREVFKLLAEEARARAVLHLTTNIDGITTHVASEHGAVWGPFTGWYPAKHVARDIAVVFQRGCGLAHLPLHGEAGLAAHPADEHAGARLLLNMPPDFAELAYSTLAEGLGREVANIESRMILSQIGYRLLLALLDGAPAEVWESDLLESYSPADLLVIGYGAGRSPARANYPFERKITEAHSRGHPIKAGRWRALIYKPDSPSSRREAEWYGDHGFVLHGYRDGDLAPVAEHALGEQRQESEG